MITRPMRRRAVGVAAACLIAATACGHAGTPAPSASAGTGPAGASPRPAPAGDSLVPASGAYLGAYVQPAADTQAGQISAVRSFEHRLGHPLQIVHVYHPWGKPFPTTADRYFVDHGKILLLTWGGAPDTRAIIAGRDDAMIRARARAVKALGHPIMLEFRHEMDRPNLQWTIHGPADYIAAWDHVRAIFSAVGATNVSWVWCPTGIGFADGRALPFYPGDQEVDWICADVYATSTSQSLHAAAAPFLRWASHHHKPVIIGEFGVIGNPRGWAPWLTAAGRLPETDHQIKAMAYFDANGVNSSGDAYQFWLGDRPAALSAFAGLLRRPYFRPAVPSDP
jgi:hypothetical protein